MLQARFDPLVTPRPIDLAAISEACCQVYESSLSMYKLSVPTMAVIRDRVMTPSFGSLDLTASAALACRKAGKSL